MQLSVEKGVAFYSSQLIQSAKEQVRVNQTAAFWRPVGKNEPDEKGRVESAVFSAFTEKL